MLYWHSKNFSNFSYFCVIIIVNANIISHNSFLNGIKNVSRSIVSDNSMLFIKIPAKWGEIGGKKSTCNALSKGKGQNN